MLLAAFAYPGPAQFLQYSGWKRGRTTFRDKAAFQTTPCSTNVLTVPASEQKGNCVQQVLFVLLRGKHGSGMRAVYLLQSHKNQLCAVRSIKKILEVGQVQRVGLFWSGSWHRI